MISGVWGKKLGMAQLFEGDKVVPVTAVDISSWIIIGTKNRERDGYDALCVGLLKKKYKRDSFSPLWLKSLSRYFVVTREVKTNEPVLSVVLGSLVSADHVFQKGISVVDVVGTSKGRGFAGAVKRHGFTGGRGSHGSAMGERRPGSISWMRRQGRVIKGKRMAGHMGVDRYTVKNLRVVDIDATLPAIFIKGAIPGHVGSLVFVRKK